MGCKFGVPGGTYPPKKYPSAPAGFRTCIYSQQLVCSNYRMLQKGYQRAPKQWRIQGDGPGVQTPPPPIRPDTCLRLKSLQRQDCISLFNWLNFLMKRVLYFATKLNSRDIKKCDCLWVPSSDLFASARKAVFSAPTATGFHRFRNTQSSLPSQ